MNARAVIVVGLTVAALAAGLGCKGDDKKATAKADSIVERLLPLVERDTKQVRDGLPQGAAELARLLPSDPGADLEGLRRALQKTRGSIRDLSYAKSTFFLFVDAKGVVQRSEGDPDLAAGKSLTDAVPEAKKFAVATSGLSETFGHWDALRGVNVGPDLEWVVGHPVVANGELRGSFVSGWSLRLYARFLEDDARRELTKEQEGQNRAIPLVYVFIAKGDGAFGAPVTPDVNAEALAKLGLPEKTKSGPYAGTVDVEKRHFVVAARAAPELADDAALAVMLSEI
ncbi:MAG: hypothetical protein IT373_24300 [Polyangiaceae bacterium]|nr:hypothetical protein [Polyangiaceae bacterium]